MYWQNLILSTECLNKCISRLIYYPYEIKECELTFYCILQYFLLFNLIEKRPAFYLVFTVVISTTLGSPPASWAIVTKTATAWVCDLELSSSDRDTTVPLT